ncbi:adenylate/guanylate cyclase domain-containing protein [Exiguobacterium sp. s133]|uniref:adenylate/guanylate cyclase domain-containing protein n=1 Tax=Exiguobacterium sp. s133 TaxID=2751213 RepID=UPI002036BB81|nr:adenylate/guanylate cyclase domain-containing protein [Exiguobacterium sp. s133]
MLEFTDYDYKNRKKEVEDILDNTGEIKEVKRFPRNEDFTYTNGYKAWASAIFVDLRDSTTLFTEHDDVEISKVIRGFTSEIIEILKKDTDQEDLKEIGIRGDCVYAIYSTPFQKDTIDITKRALYINTYLKMLNKLLTDRQLPTIKAGIGLNIGRTLTVKAGRKSSGINNLVWIGESVSIASKLADLGNKNSVNPIVLSSIFHFNYVKAKGNNEEKNWTEEFDSNHGTYYHANRIITDFNDWIVGGMKE